MVFQDIHLDQVNRAVETREAPAGKAVNVAKVLRALGQRPVVCGFFGGERGRAILDQLHASGIDCDVVNVNPETRLCITAINQVSGEQTELVEESQAVPDSKYEKLIAIVRRNLRSSRALVMSGTLTPGAPVSFYARCVVAASQAKCLAVVDAQGPSLLAALDAKPSLVKPNRRELSDTLKKDLSDLAQLQRALRVIAERGAQNVVVTSGAEGIVAFDGQRFFKITPPKIKSLNSIGSGDSFTAALTWRLLAGDDLGQACAWGAAAGAANALSLMPGELEKKTVEKLVRSTQVRKTNPE